MYRKEHYYAVIVLSILGSLRLAAGQTVHGTVKDPSGAVIENATVQLIFEGRVEAATVTGHDGRFSIPVTNENRVHSIMAAASGFAPDVQFVQGTDADELDLSFVLQIAPYRHSVEIHASMPFNQTILDMSGVRESTAKDVGEALTALDGVWMIRKAGIANDLVVRGFQQNNVNVLVDGSRTYGACPSHMDPPAQHVDFAEVDRIEVTKGAFDVANQGSLGAVVNIITKRPGAGFEVKPSLSTGSFGFYNPSITASYGNRIVRALAGYSFRTSEPYKDGSGRRFTDYAPYSAAGQRQRSFDINTGWFETEISPSDRQQISVGYSRQQAGLILYPYLTMDSDRDNADRVTARYSVRDLQGTLRNIRAEAYFTEVAHFMSDSQRTSAMMGSWMMASDASSRTAGGRVEVDIGRDLTGGVETYSRNWNILGYMKKAGSTIMSRTVPDVDTWSTGSFLSYRHTIAEKVSLTGGVRFDHAQMQATDAATDLYYRFHNTRRTGSTDNYASGNVVVGFTLPKATRLYIGLGSTGRIPDAEERFISRAMGSAVMVGNPLLSATHNTEVTAGWSLNRAGFYIRPEFFYSFLDDFILVNLQPGVSTSSMSARSYTNIPARIYGGEMTYGLRITEALSLNGGGSYQRGRTTPNPQVNVLSRNLPEMPPLQGWSSLRYAHRFAYAEVGAVAVNRQSAVSSDLHELPTAGYGLMNLKLGLTHNRLSASFVVENLFNRYYSQHLSYFRDPFAAGRRIPEPGRNFFVQLRYAF